MAPKVIAEYAWTARRNESKKKLGQVLSILKAKSFAFKEAEIAATAVDRRHRKVEVSFNKIVGRSFKRSYLARFKTPTHTLSGKYTPTAMALLDFLESDYAESIGVHNDLDRWILAQVELIKATPHFNLYHCYGQPALERYQAWETKQVKKFPRKANREEQTDSRDETIKASILRGHAAAMGWVPQLKVVNPPDLATALFFLLPHIQGWYALCYQTFREDVMENGLCDQKQMVAWYGMYKRSAKMRALCASSLESAEKLLGKLAW